MKLDLQENMYIRTKYGIIDKILKLNKSYVKGVSQKDELYAYDIDNIVKASYNIIDILEVGDYVNGFEILRIDKECDLYPKNLKCQYPNNIDYFNIFNEDIKSVITHEQMEQMAYKVGE